MARPRAQDPQFDKGIACVGVLLKASANSDVSLAIPIYAGAGVPTDVTTTPALWVRTDPADINTVLYTTTGDGTWNAYEANPGAAVIADTNTYYVTDTVNGALDALALQIGGDTDAAYAFGEQNVLADDDALYAALNKLDLKWGDLASVANGEGASLVGLEDSAGYLAAADVEAAIAEIAAVTVRKNAAASGNGVVLTSETPGTQKLVLTLTDVEIPLVDEAGVVAYGGLKIADLPEGAITFLGATADLAMTKSSAGVNDTWDGDFGLGTTTAGNDATLATTEQDLIPTTATPQAVAGATTAKGQSTATEVGAVFDGTTTAIDVFLNFLVDDADHDVGGTPCNLIANGTITIVYAHLGDH